MGVFPPARLVELLTDTKRGLIAAGHDPTSEDFDRAWEQAWAVLVRERAFPRDPDQRKAWRSALKGTRPEFRACWLDRPTAFGVWQDAILAEVDRADLGGDAVIGSCVA